ncbi:MAG: arsenate reductase (glutaredoxin) [Bacteroidota bacterium]|nr:arsenate reductase (glutaredoxin) [Bacteroidota bacterium]MDX5430961.1 arsenate reductase (glutaredoxin) [Bacteroidota bacterium]MDX5469712.1 arsenate reductase (glutaredoxin) [Bacteroidota bacterium]
MEFYHNPRCGKSRTALALLTEKGIEPTVREYLKDQPDFATLQAVIKKHGIAPHDLIRTGEAVYKENFKGKSLIDEAWIQAMVDHPILIERPIFIKGDKAVVGRPPEKVLDL